MDQNVMNQMIELITREVMARLAEKGEDLPPQQQGLDKVLVVGESETPVPAALTKNAVVFDCADYEQNRNILRYKRVVVKKLTITQLADIALGRCSDCVSCAVIYALLSGVEVVMLDDALSFRRFAAQGSTALYRVLEGYANTIQVYGVKPYSAPVERELAPAKPPKFSAPAVEVPVGSAKPNCGRVVTEDVALALVRDSKCVRLCKKAIVTPAARDVFAAAQAEVTFED